MHKIKAPLAVITGGFSVGFIDGFFGLEFSNDLYTFVGLGLIAGLVWAWVVVKKG